jgi:hypothetical protein
MRSVSPGHSLLASWGLKLLLGIAMSILLIAGIALLLKRQSSPAAESTVPPGESLVSQLPTPETMATDPAVVTSSPSNDIVPTITTVTVSGRRLMVDNEPFTTKGVGYAPTPIGDDPDISPAHGDYFTSGYSAIYRRDLPLLREMGANTVRLWGWKYDADHSDFLDAAFNNGVRPIYVVASYWLDASRDISDPSVRQAIKAEFTQMVAIHKDHPAILVWAIGNELNAPWMFGDSDDLFSLIDEMAQAAHAEEGASFHPVTTPLADINLIGTIAARDPEVPNLDMWAAQVYRGSSFGSLFSDYQGVSDKPLIITEYGIDAYDDETAGEYENGSMPYQATYAESLWKEIEAHSDVCPGGSIMAYSDEWWKGRSSQTDANHPGCPDFDPLFHSSCGYANGAHPDGYSNEEWWGIMRTVDGGTGPDVMQPRTVYYTLQGLWTHKLYLPAVLREVQ